MQTINGIEIDWGEKLWKYFSTKYFIELLKTKKIYFASPNQFNDPFEGAVAVQTISEPVDFRYSEMESDEKAFLELKRLTKVNCWHRAEYESNAMWNLYAKKSKGIAICSSPNKLRLAVREFRLKKNYAPETLWAGPVQYIDLTQVRMGKGMLERFFWKHRAFEWEKEFRLAISLCIAEEFCVKTPECGIKVDVELNTMIEQIVLGPSIPDSQLSKIMECIKDVGLEHKVISSSMLGKPRYI